MKSGFLSAAAEIMEIKLNLALSVVYSERNRLSIYYFNGMSVFENVFLISKLLPTSSFSKSNLLINSNNLYLNRVLRYSEGCFGICDRNLLFLPI